MKRGFILAILSLFIFVTFSGFVIPEKGYAYLPQIGDQSSSLSSFGNSDTPANSATPAYSQDVTVTGNKNYDAFQKCIKDGGSFETCSLNYNISGGAGTEFITTNTCPAGQHSKLTVGGSVTCTDNTTPEQDAKDSAAINGATGSGGNILGNNTTGGGAGGPNVGQEEKTDACSFINIGECVKQGFDWFIRNTVLQIGTWALTMGSFLLDASINYGIIHFSEWVPPGITSLWKLVRDILYLCIVFIGFYLAFMYIIGKDDKFKKFIPKLIIFALFVNFSLPISKTMIDMSNIVALNIYNSALSGLPSGGTSIMDKIGLNTLLTENAKMQGSNIPATLLSIIFVFFATWVFFQVAILMLVRTAVLTLCLIGSPLLLIDATVTIPAFGERIKKVRSLFFNQLFMADVFMIMFFITLQVMVVLKQGMLAINDSAGLSAPPQLGNVSLIFGVFMMLMLLYFMMKITKSMSGEVGALATGFVNNGVGLLAGGVAMRGAALAGRATLGRGAANILKNTETGVGGWINKNQDTFLGRKAYDLSHSAANATFDARNTAVAQKFSTRTGVSLGKGGNVGYEKEEAIRQKDIVERGKRINTTYTKDQYGKHQNDIRDSDGKIIAKKGETNYDEILHRKGDVNKAGAEAALRYQKTAGGTLLADKEKARENIIDYTKEIQKKQDSEINEGSRLYLANYKNKKDDEKDKYLNSLKEDLGKIKEVDKNGTGAEAQKLIQAIEAIHQGKTIEKIEPSTKPAEDLQGMIEGMVEERAKKIVEEKFKKEGLRLVA